MRLIMAKNLCACMVQCAQGDSSSCGDGVGAATGASPRVSTRVDARVGPGEVVDDDGHTSGPGPISSRVGTDSGSADGLSFEEKHRAYDEAPERQQHNTDRSNGCRGN